MINPDKVLQSFHIFMENKAVDVFTICDLRRLSVTSVKTSCFFTPGDLLIMRRLGHDGGAGKRRVIRGGRNQRGHTRRHGQ